MELRSKSAERNNIPTSKINASERKRRGRKPKASKNESSYKSLELSCPSFACDILSELHRLYQEGVCCDVILSAGDYQTSTHRVVLMASSEYLRSLFASSNLANDFVILPPDVKSDALKLLMSFMYTGLLHLNVDNVLSVLCAALQLQIKSAVDLCNRFLTCNGTNVDQSFSLPSPGVDAHSDQIKALLPLISSGVDLPLGQIDDIVIKEEVAGIDEAEFESKVPALDLLSVENPSECRITSVKRRKRTKVQSLPKSLVNGLTNMVEESTSLHNLEELSRLKRAKRDSSAFECDFNPEMEAVKACHKSRSSARSKKSRTAICMSKPKKRRKNACLSRNSFYAVVRKPTPVRKVVTPGKVLLAHGTAHNCRICNAGFDRYMGILLHLKFSHEVPVLSLATRTSRHLLKLNALRLRNASTCENDTSSRRLFSCSFCSHEFCLRACLLAHLLKCHPEKRVVLYRQKYSSSVSSLSDSLAKHNRLMRPRVFKCRFCCRSFAHRSSLSSHCLVNHKRIKKEAGSEDDLPKEKSLRGSWSCQETDCGIMFSCLRELKKHMAANHPNVIYSCPDCRFSCQVDRIFQRHRNQRHGKKQVCHLCGKACPKLSLLKQHMYVHHKIKDPTLKLYQCAFEGCTYECCSKNRLADHCRRHNLSKSLKCEECGKAFKHTLGLQKHVSTIHEGIRPFICDQCGMGFGAEGELKTHVTRHSKNKPYACGFCPYRCCAKINLQYHLFSRHKAQATMKEQKLVVLKCDQCDFTTSRKGRLEDHLKKHRNVRDIPCPECGKLFITKKNLYGHTVTVHRPKTLKCAYCNYSSALLSAFKDHVRIMHTHRHEKRYECPICRFRSATSGNCRKHIQRTHKEFSVNPRYVGAPRKLDMMHADIEESAENAKAESTMDLSCNGS